MIQPSVPSQPVVESKITPLEELKTPEAAPIAPLAGELL